MKKLEMIGNKYGELIVKGEHSKDHNGHIKFLCECVCGNDHIANGSHLRRLNITHCGCKSKKGKDHPLFSGNEDISGNWWCNHIIRASNGKYRKEKIVSITPKYAYDLYIKQNKRCVLSNILIFINDKTDYNTASLDRIDNTKGYIEGNVQWVHKDINMMKRIYNQDYFIKMCTLVSNNFNNSDEH
jgi:hypothetical protein